ncbi:response regulator [Noviherbaspirillum denitrificans]|nr:response regulator [Noviherbaspirillum denitrificans]
MCPTNLMASLAPAALLAASDSAYHPHSNFLVVDDISSMRRVIGSLLKDQLRNVRISEAADGRSALQMLKSADAEGKPFDFVVTDCHMPNMSGLDLLRAIREEEGLRDLPVLLVTAEATRDMILAAAKAGADGYIVKPFNADTLRTKLQQILSKRARSRRTDSSVAIAA